MLKRLFSILTTISILSILLVATAFAGRDNTGEKSFDSKEHYLGVPMQKGGVQLDSDWNEGQKWDCPKGWHHVDGVQGFPGACKPNTPVPTKCPRGMKWKDDGCNVGCI